MEDLEWSVRPATVEDAEALAEIVMEATKAQGRWPAMSDAAEDAWRAGFVSWSREQATAGDPGNTLSVVEAGGQPIGRLRIVRDVAAAPSGDRGRRIELAGIQLRPTSQSRGIGTAIVRQLQAEAAEEQVPLVIAVEKDNHHARRLYERLGCVQVGENEGEYVLRWESARLVP